jgi:ATP-binding cassette subfamily C (CFTR/MRP) protein 1
MNRRRQKLLTICSVGRNTEVVVQGIIERHFASHTVLSVMHRLEHVRKYDKIVLLEAGEVVEFDDPVVLLARPSRFAALYASREQ